MLRSSLLLAALAALALTASAGAATPVLKAPRSATVTEGKALRIAVSLPKPAAKRTVVRWSLNGAADFLRTKGALVIAKGRRGAKLRLVTKQDAVHEGTEPFRLKLGKRTVKISVVDDDPAPATPGAATPAPTPLPSGDTTPAPEPAAPAVALPTVSVKDLSRGESLVDKQQPEVVLSFPAPTDVVVHYESVDGTAKAGADFTKLAGDLTIKAGATSALLPLQVTSDTIDEDDGESFTVVLSAPQGATLGDAEGTVTILDDDAKPALTVSDGTPRLENATTMPFTLTLNRASIHTITVQVAASGITATGGASCATPGVDFVAFSALTVTFAPGETSKTVNVMICEDAVSEADETLKLVASNLSSFATMSDAQGNGTIQQDED